MPNKSDRFRCECGQSFENKDQLQQHQQSCPVVSKQSGGKTRTAGGQSRES